MKLLVIGFVHGLLVRVDILLVYALLGFVLVLMYKWPTKYWWESPFSFSWAVPR